MPFGPWQADVEALVPSLAAMVCRRASLEPLRRELFGCVQASETDRRYLRLRDWGGLNKGNQEEYKWQYKWVSLSL
jgi:hypothetical protein